MLQTLRAEKVDQKNGVICFLPELWSKTVQKKKVFLLQLCADLNKKSKSIKAIYIYTSESSLSILSENGMVYRGPSHRS